MSKRFYSILASAVLAAALPLSAQVPDETPYQEPAPADEIEVTAEATATVPNPDLDNDSDIAVDETSADDSVELDELPQTATPLPLLALLGALGVGSAVGIRLVTRS